MSRRESLVYSFATLSSDWVKAQFDCLEDDYFLRFSAEEIFIHLEAIQNLGQKPLFVQIEPKANGFELTLITTDLPGLFPLICGSLSSLNMSIISGDNYTYKNSTSSKIKTKKCVIDTLLIELSDENRSLSQEACQAEIFSRIQSLIAIAQKEGMNVVRDQLHAYIGEKLSAQKSKTQSPLLPIEIEIDHDSQSTWLDIKGQDTPAFLFLLSNTLSIMGYSIQKVEIRTHLDQVHDLIWITDRQDQPIVRKEQLEKIRTTVALAKQFSHFLPHASSYESAFKNFYNFLNQTFSADENLLKTMNPQKSLGLMASIFGSGDFLWESFTKMQFEHLTPLFKSEQSFKVEKSRQDHLLEMRALIQDLEDFDEKIQKFNLYKDNELFRIDLGYLIHSSITFSDFANQLTALAEASLEKIAKWCYAEVAQKMGEPIWNEGTCPWSLLALGKFGGHELGYASDLELMVVFAGNGKTKHDKNSDSNQEFFNRFVKKLRSSFKVKTDGIFELDFRLSPYATEGMLACSFSTWQDYFKVGGAAHDVERQALVRMRPVWGESAFCQSLIEVRNRILYFGFKPNKDEFLRLHAVQQNSHVQPGKINAKYSTGGLVEIEYPLQWLQITHAEKYPALMQVTSCIKIMEILLEQSIISPTTFEKLFNAYAFMRRIINALRLVRGNAKDMVLPNVESQEYAYLARKLQYNDTQSASATSRLNRDLTKHMLQIHQFFHCYFFENSVNPPFGEGLPELVLRQMEADEAEDFLRQLGIVEPDKIRLMLQRLFDMLQDKKSLIAVLVMALRWIKRSPQPDRVFLAFEQFLLNAEECDGFVEQLLYSPQTIRTAVTVFGQSQFLSDVVAKDPPYLHHLIFSGEVKVKKSCHQFIEELSVLLETTSDFEQKIELIRKYRNQEYLRIGLRDFYLFQSLERITHEISDLTDALVQMVYEQVFIHSNVAELLTKQVIIAMGKLGGAEINYSSDIDFVFVLTDATLESELKTKLEKANIKVLKALSGSSQFGQLFRVDTTLRPYGTQGGLVGSQEHYRKYYEQECEGWEWQIWLKARAICGDIQSGQDLIAEIQKRSVDPQNFARINESIADFRLKVLGRLKRKNQWVWEVKSGPGGIRVVEFLVQGLQIQQGASHPEIISGSTLKGLDLLVKSGLMDAELAQDYAEKYIFLRKIEHVLQLDEMAQEHLIPEDSAKRHILALKLGFEDLLGENALVQFDREYLQTRDYLMVLHEKAFPGLLAQLPDL